MNRFILLFWVALSMNVFAKDINISINPVSVSECIGKQTNIFINAESGTNKKLIYQWFKDSEKIMGEASPVLNFPSLQHYQSGLYFCRVSAEDGSESVDSRFASVYVLRPTSISKEPEDVKISTFNGNVFLNFEAHVNGFSVEEAIQKGEYVNIQWYRINDNIHIPLENDNIFSGTNTNRLSINLNSLPDTTNYFATIEGKCGTVTTKTVSVIKNHIEFELNLSIEDLDVCEGTVQSLKANINNPQNHKLEFRWYKDGKQMYFKENIKGIYSEELMFNPINRLDSGNYKIEAKIKGATYSVFSNEVKLFVNWTPKIICLRADTLRAGTDGHYLYLNTLQLSIFYEFNPLPTKFDIYREGVLVSSQNSDDSRWNLGNVYFLNLPMQQVDSSVYWIIAQNKCGIYYSDTVSLFKQNFCDPYNQFILDFCDYQQKILQLNHHPKEPLNELKYYWNIWSKNYVIKFLVENDFSKPVNNKVRFLDLNFPISIFADSSSIYNYDIAVNVRRKKGNIDTTEDYFCCFYIQYGQIPILKRQPLNKMLKTDDKDTLFNLVFENDYNKKITYDLYFMASLNAKPKLIKTGEPEFGLWYYYIKDVEYSDDGYYFATYHYDNYCDTLSTDTIKVTVIPKGIVSGINGNELNSGIEIYPNPTSGFLTIQPSEGFKSLEGYKVQIYDMLGIEVISIPSLRNTPQERNFRIDVSGLSSGVYYIRIGDRVEKFVKI